MRQESFLQSLPHLQEFLLHPNGPLEEAIQTACSKNPWFTPEFSHHAIKAIANEFLDIDKCRKWMESYPIKQGLPKTVGIVMAGNVPLVGFHDLLCVLASGHNAMIKMSDKDSVLTKFITDEWISIQSDMNSRILYSDRLENFDAVIATGSNNSARYFDYYFRNHPHILRQNRNGIAVLTGDESMEELKLLSDDIFMYFGLGCRNVSKLFVPEGYDFSSWNHAVAKWKELGDHNKYRNNLDYNYAIYIINQVPHLQLGHLILKEDEAIASRIGCVHFSYYNDEAELMEQLEQKRNEIQCLVSTNTVEGWAHVAPGQTQFPGLFQYADGVDTMNFLTSPGS